MAVGSTLVLVGELLGQIIPAVVGAIKDAIDGGKATAEDFRKRPLVVSVAFKGGDGEAAEVLAEIEADLTEPVGERTTEPLGDATPIPS